MDIERDAFLKSIVYLLAETFQGSPAGEGSVYLDRGVGFFDTLAKISAEAASYEINSTTVAAQTEHAKFYLDRLCEFAGGRTERVNWEDSWLIEDVNESEWDALRSGVRKSYEAVLRCLAAVEDWDERKVGMAMGMLAHTAYHLGAIRQLAKAAVQNTDNEEIRR